MQALLRCAKTVRMPHNNEPTVVRVGMHTGGCRRVCVYVCMRTCVYLCVSMCDVIVCACACVCLCVCVCVFVCVCVQLGDGTKLNFLTNVYWERGCQ